MEINSSQRLKRNILTLRLIGILSLIIGLASLIIAPLEFYVYYLFSQSGSFHYQGFGFGSFMFAAITFQIIAYYLIGIVFLILAYGHLKLKYWLKPYSIILLKFWLIIGLPVIIVVILFILMSKNLSFLSGIFFIFFTASLYFIVPFLLLNFYKDNTINGILIKNKSENNWLNKYPDQIMVLVALYVFSIICLHIPLFFNGIFPFFGILLNKLTGIVFLEISIVVLTAIIYGTLVQKYWAWRLGILYFLIFFISISITFFEYSYLEFLTILNLPEREMSIFNKLPIENYYLILFSGLPILGIIFIIYNSKKYFKFTNS